MDPDVELGFRDLLTMPLVERTITLTCVSNEVGGGGDGHLGVGTVQARVDGGDWHDARLAAVASTDTWRQWV